MAVQFGDGLHFLLKTTNNTTDLYARQQKLQCKHYITQPCLPLGSLNRVPALVGWGKGGNVTSAGWQAILCDPIWHVSSRSGEACGELLYPVTLLYFTGKSNYTRRIEIRKSPMRRGLAKQKCL